MGFPGGSDSKESALDTGDLGLIPGLGTSGGGHVNFQYFLPGERKIVAFNSPKNWCASQMILKDGFCPTIFSFI